MPGTAADVRGLVVSRQRGLCSHGVNIPKERDKKGISSKQGVSRQKISAKQKVKTGGGGGGGDRK